MVVEEGMAVKVMVVAAAKVMAVAAAKLMAVAAAKVMAVAAAKVMAVAAAKVTAAARISLEAAAKVAAAGSAAAGSAAVGSTAAVMRRCGCRCRMRSPLGHGVRRGAHRPPHRSARMRRATGCRTPQLRRLQTRSPTPASTLHRCPALPPG